MVNRITAATKGRTQADRLRQSAVLVASLLLAIVFSATIFLTINNNNKLLEILDDSVRSGLIAACSAAQAEVDMDLFVALNSKEDIETNKPAFDVTVAKLRTLKEEIGASYIYTLKEIDGRYYFVFDTDEELENPDSPYNYFTQYELSPVHREAFAGNSSADIMNVFDEWGGFNTGAVPLYHNDEIVGIICVDFEDSYIQLSRTTAQTDGIILAVVLATTMGLLIAFLIHQTRRNKTMNADLYRLVNNDFITGLLNRYYFYSYFGERAKHANLRNEPYGLLFIDLDNFKKVNDVAGHDMGDELLRLIAVFLESHSSTCSGKSTIQSMTCRIGGDEFLQTLPGASTEEEVAKHAHALLEDFAKIPELQHFIKGYNIGLSIGGALYPSQINDYDELVRLADIAMYAAKEQGKSNFAFYDKSMDAHAESLALGVR